jgi:hypothetical protein
MRDAIDAAICWSVGAIFAAKAIHGLFTGRQIFKSPNRRQSEPWLFWFWTFVDVVVAFLTFNGD